MGKKSKQKQNRKVSHQAPDPIVSHLSMGTALGQKLGQPATVKLEMFGDYAYVRKDIARILWLLLALVGLLGVTYIINLQTTWLISAGSQISSFLHF